MTTLPNRTGTSHSHPSHSHDRHASHWPATVVILTAAIALGYWKNKENRQSAAREPAVVAMSPVGQANASSPANVQPVDVPHVTAKSPIDAGRYLVKVGGCNDCHTGGFAMKNGAVPESEWLTGDVVGFRGPWGTSYPSNLRLVLKDMSEDLFIKTMRERSTRPPMPWPSLHAMSDADLRAVYHYIKSLEVSGSPAPEALSPGEEPKTPYINFVPVMPTTQG